MGIASCWTRVLYSHIMLGNYKRILNHLNIVNRTRRLLENMDRAYNWQRFRQMRNWGFTKYRKKPKGGGRFLSEMEEEANILKYNAWDNVHWNEEQEEEAEKTIEQNSSIRMSQTDSFVYRMCAHVYWDRFYNEHGNRFFKDRQWLFTEFPELEHSKNESSKTNESNFNVFELGCGVGNTILPILKSYSSPKAHIYGCDFSEKALELLKENKDFDATRCTLFVMNVVDTNWRPHVPFEEGSLDIILLIFVLSAIERVHFPTIIEQCKLYLKPGGLILLRDYGRYDLTQLRFKAGKCIDENLYVRGDGTLAYFFTQTEVRELFLNAGFIEVQNTVDKRLQVNRSRRLKMYRVWIQAKYRKPLSTP